MVVLMVGEFKTQLPTQYAESVRKGMMLGQAKLYNFSEVGLKRKMGEIAELNDCLRLAYYCLPEGVSRPLMIPNNVQFWGMPGGLEHEESAKSADSLLHITQYPALGLQC